MIAKTTPLQYVSMQSLFYQATTGWDRAKARGRKPLIPASISVREKVRNESGYKAMLH
jgi:hypothetical protein